MQAELHRLPSLFATTDANVTLMTNMGASTTTLCIYSSTPDGKSFKKEIQEEELNAFRESTASAKSAAMGWDRLFDEIQLAFNNGRVKCDNGQNVEIHLTGDTHIARFVLESTQENCQKLIFDGLLFFHFVHSNTKEAERQYEEILKKE